MTDQDGASYYWVRAAEEMNRGDRADNPTVAAVHFEMAYRYGIIATQKGQKTPTLRLIDGGKSDVCFPKYMTA